MIKQLVLITIFTTLSSPFPTHDKSSVKKVVVIPADKDDLKTAETFYSGYNTGYQGGGYGWRGDQKPIVGGPAYGGGYEIGYVGVPVGSYGPYAAGPGAVVVGARPVATGGGGYGWRQGVNPWAL